MYLPSSLQTSDRGDHFPPGTQLIVFFTICKITFFASKGHREWGIALVNHKSIFKVRDRLCTFCKELNIDKYSMCADHLYMSVYIIMKHMTTTAVGYMLSYVPLQDFSLLWRHYHYQWRATKFRLCSGSTIIN
jgi:hypothetical protein